MYDDVIFIFERRMRKNLFNLLFKERRERYFILRELRSCCFVELGTKLYSKMVKYNRKKKMHGFYIKRK